MTATTGHTITESERNSCELELSADRGRPRVGLEYNAVLEAGGFMIGDKVTIELDVEAVLQTESELVGR